MSARGFLTQSLWEQKIQNVFQPNYLLGSLPSRLCFLQHDFFVESMRVWRFKPFSETRRHLRALPVPRPSRDYEA
jgi:hypothetical protein